MEIEFKKTEELIPYEKNSRTHSEHQINQIIKSIREFGFTNPILIDEKDTVLAGHGRLAAANKLSMKTVPTIRIPNLTNKQKKAYVIADNKLALNAEWDVDTLQSELRFLIEDDFNIDIIGFGTDELTDLLMGNEEEEEEEEKAPKIKDEKFLLEVHFNDRESMIKKYDDLLSEGLIVKAKNG